MENNGVDAPQGNATPKRQVTLFSTRLIREEKCLFGPDAKEAEKEKYQKTLLDYFVRLDALVIELLENDTSKEALRFMLQKHIEVNIKNPTEYDVAAAKRLNKTISTQFFNNRINAEVNNSNLEALCARIMCWNLETEFYELCAKSENMKKIIDNFAIMYQLGNSDVYAVRCLDEGYLDLKQERWVPCLVCCLKQLITPVDNKDEELDICLVLHDAEFGRDTEYAKHDVMRATDEDVVKLTASALNGDHCRILFFQHTTNPVTNILHAVEEKPDEIHREVRHLMDLYGELGKHIKNSREALNDAQGIEKCKQVNKDLIETVKELKR